jgi:hypothetical protein
LIDALEVLAAGERPVQGLIRTTRKAILSVSNRSLARPSLNDDPQRTTVLRGSGGRF